ncbi:hypothetical protein NEUTE2DRAFT_67814, partial [Neurospora tetrasperma FGSC 2509]
YHACIISLSKLPVQPTHTRCFSLRTHRNPKKETSSSSLCIDSLRFLPLPKKSTKQ